MAISRVRLLGGLLSAILVASAARAQDRPKGPPCVRPAAGAAATSPVDLYSQNGVLDVDMVYSSSTDTAGRALYCFVTSDGLESPTLHVKPGDTLDITLTNRVGKPIPPHIPDMGMPMPMGPAACADQTSNSSSVNIHFHGANTKPACHSDEVIHTVINNGRTFQYRVKFPLNEPPGLYWYHPHIHGISESAVQGGGTGALIVDGIEAYQPIVAGLPERTLVIRDQTVAGSPPPGGLVPSWDLTLNYVPIAYPSETPAVIDAPPGEREFWRVVNASADTIVDIGVKYDGVLQPLGVVGRDGVPIGSQDGEVQGEVLWSPHILLPAAGRAEFIVTTPPVGVKRAVFVSRRVDTGPGGDNDPPRTLAVLRIADAASGPTARMPALAAAPSPPPLFDRLDAAKINESRLLYFSEQSRPPAGVTRRTRPSESRIDFFITVDGATPVLFSPDNPPAIVTTQGSVEAWTIENRTTEVHEFHIHQIHFKLQRRDGLTLPPREQLFLDTVQIPYWTGAGPYPSVTLLMDFRGAVVGDFVYHCHILEHEDAGMMAIIRVLPRVSASKVFG
ncbi:MAG: multicopper oxidase domain-containing protein [Caulobacteraceae bacterium]